MRMMQRRGINTATPKSANQIQTYGQGGLVFDSTRFDTFTLVPNQDLYQFFKNGSGTKTPALTNMEDDSQFPTNVGFIVHEIGFRISAPVLAVDGSEIAYTAEDISRLHQMLSQTTLTVNISGFQNMGVFPVSEWLSAEQFTIGQNTDAVAGAPFGTNTVFSPNTQWKRLRTPIAIQPRAIFSFDLKFNSAQSGQTIGTGSGVKGAEFGSALLVDSTTLKPFRVQVLIKGIEQRRS